MSTYGDLNDAFAKAFNRILGSIGKESFQMQVLSKFPLVLTTQSVKDIASVFGFDDRELIPPVNKRTRANQAIAHTQHIGLMLRQGQAAQVGGQLRLQQQHGAAPQVQASPAAPAAGAHGLGIPVTPGNAGSQVIHEMQPPQTPVPNRRRLPPGTPLALTFEAAAPGTPNPAASGTPAVPQTPLVSHHAAVIPAPAASAQANVAESPAVAASARNEGAIHLPGASLAASAAAPIPAAGPAPAVASMPIGDTIGDSSGPEPPAINGQVQAESAQVENESLLLCVICQAYMDPRDGQALEALPCGHSFHSCCLREWRRVAGIDDLHKCPLHPQSTPQPAQQGVAGDDDFELVDAEESDHGPAPSEPHQATATGPELL